MAMAALALGSLCVRAHPQGNSAVVCSGMCDASALMTAGKDFFLVADDESNRLRVYSRLKGGAPLQTFDLSAFLGIEPKSPEADLEAATRLGDRVYWISSQGRNKEGKDSPNRRRFFATSLSVTNGKVSLKPVGAPYRLLLADLMYHRETARLRLDAASLRAPKEKGGLSIEGLCDTPEGHLLLGFRNPIPENKALLVPLLNPGEVISGQRARVGSPILLDLGGLGIRSLARSGSRYFIIAGAYDGKGRSFLYEWSGGPDVPRRLKHPELRDLNPEAMEFFEEDGATKLLVASDDGSLNIGGEKCKEVQDPNARYFRITTLLP
jgi:hypothetical protein